LSASHPLANISRSVHLNSGGRQAFMAIITESSFQWIPISKHARR